MDRKEFEGIVLEALAHVPEGFRQRLENVVVVVEREPGRRLLREMDIPEGDTLLGLYQGVPLDERDAFFGNALPDRISLYMDPILEECEYEDEIPELVREVVAHEIGHFFGLDDDEIEALLSGGD